MFFFQVTDIYQMCLLVDALRPDECREVFARRGFLNVTNPIFADRYYRLDLSVWDDREMAKIRVVLLPRESGKGAGFIIGSRSTGKGVPQYMDGIFVQEKQKTNQRDSSGDPS